MRISGAGQSIHFVDMVEGTKACEILRGWVWYPSVYAVGFSQYKRQLWWMPLTYSTSSVLTICHRGEVALPTTRMLIVAELMRVIGSDQLSCR